MQAQQTLNASVTSSPSAMRMWEWFDMWSLYQEWVADEGRVLFENEEGVDEDSAEAKEKQHDFYLKHFKDVLTNHTKMSDEQREQRKKAVASWAKGKENLGDIHKVRAGGHDVKSAHSGFAIIGAALASQHGTSCARQRDAPVKMVVTRARKSTTPRFTLAS